MSSIANSVSDNPLYTIKLGGEILTGVPSHCLEFILRREENTIENVVGNPHGERDDGGQCFECGGNSSEELSSSEDELPL